MPWPRTMKMSSAPISERQANEKPWRKLLAKAGMLAGKRTLK